MVVEHNVNAKLYSIHCFVILYHDGRHIWRFSLELNDYIRHGRQPVVTLFFMLLRPDIFGASILKLNYYYFIIHHGRQPSLVANDRSIAQLVVFHCFVAGCFVLVAAIFGILTVCCQPAIDTKESAPVLLSCGVTAITSQYHMK